MVWWHNVFSMTQEGSFVMVVISHTIFPSFSKCVFLVPSCARLNTLQVANLDEFTPITKVADFVTLLGTYSQGFAIIVDPYPEAQGSSAENIAASCSFYPSSMSGGILCKFNSILRLSEHEVSTTQH